MGLRPICGPAADAGFLLAGRRAAGDSCTGGSRITRSPCSVCAAPSACTTSRSPSGSFSTCSRSMARRTPRSSTSPIICAAESSWTSSVAGGSGGESIGSPMPRRNCVVEMSSPSTRLAVSSGIGSAGGGLGRGAAGTGSSDGSGYTRVFPSSLLRRGGAGRGSADAPPARGPCPERAPADAGRAEGAGASTTLVLPSEVSRRGAPGACPERADADASRACPEAARGGERGDAGRSRILVVPSRGGSPGTGTMSDSPRSVTTSVRSRGRDA